MKNLLYHSFITLLLLLSVVGLSKESYATGIAQPTEESIPSIIEENIILRNEHKTTKVVKHFLPKPSYSQPNHGSQFKTVILPPPIKSLFLRYRSLLI